MNLNQIGLCNFFSDQVDSDLELSQLARVIAVHKGECDITNGNIIRSAKMTGKMRHEAESKLDFPTVGDWVIVKSFNTDQICQIKRVLHRKNMLKRKNAGRSNNEQLIAANIDTAFVIQALGPSFSINRIERFVVLINENNITPKIILTKTDLLDQDECKKIKMLIHERIPNIDIFMCSNETKKGLEEIESLFVSNKTYCVIGPSGVGKSTLLNNLLGEDILFTLPSNKETGRGVHSTTWRELITLKNGAHVIDTPGLRELGYVEVNQGIVETFTDIEELSKKCYFKNCNHKNTKGCAIVNAVKQGAIEEKRFLNFLKISDEAKEAEKKEVQKITIHKKNYRFYRSSNNNKDN